MKLFLTLFSIVLLCSAIFPQQDDELAKSIARGKTVYTENCISCHMGKGEGVPQTFPPLANADFLLKTPEKAIHAIKFGLEGKIIVNGAEFNNSMPSPGLDDDEIADVMNFIQNSWGNKSEKMVTEKMVADVKEKSK